MNLESFLSNFRGSYHFASFFVGGVFNNLRAGLLGFVEFLYFCEWWWLIVRWLSSGCYPG